jgi:hypothetical protein
MWKRTVIGAIFAAWIFNGALPAQVPAKADFRRDIQPLLREYCIGCHGPSQQINGLRLDRRSSAFKVGTGGTNLAPGNSTGSRVYLKLIGNQYGAQMPPTGALRTDQIKLIKDWIDQGAEWPDDAAGEKEPTAADPDAARLMQALRDGDRQAFRKILDSVPKAAKLQGSQGATPLMYAALYGEVDSLRALLDAGAEPNTRNDAGATALMWAVESPEKVRLLLERRADPNAPLQAYAPKPRRAEYMAAVQRALRWLREAKPQTTEEQAMQLLGLAWAGVKSNDNAVRKAADVLIGAQKSDGGWAQLPTLGSDAYATGQVLVALKETGALRPSDPVYKRGVRFLLDTQLEDGSWYVKGRSIKIQPYFESGFPHGHDQWISAAATNWASMALAFSGK